MALQVPEFLKTKTAKTVLVTIVVLFGVWLIWKLVVPKSTTVVTQPAAPKTTVSVNPDGTTNVTTGG